jgi:hypothetical protein
MSADSIFGVSVGGHDVDAALVAVYDKWLETYLHYVARNSGESFERLRMVRSIRVSTEMEAMPEDQRPVLIIVNNGLEDIPARGAMSGSLAKAYIAMWEYQVGVQVVAKGQKQSAVPRAVRLAWLYMQAVRLNTIQQAADELIPNNPITWVDWKMEEPSGLDSTADRTSCLVTATFNITTPNAATWGTGPIEPGWPPEEDDQPLPDDPTWPVVPDKDHIHIGLEKVPIEDEVGGE